MSTIAEVESAIEKLPTPQVEELAVWLESHRAQRVVAQSAGAWLDRARGAACLGVTTADIMHLTRSERD